MICRVAISKIKTVVHGFFIINTLKYFNISILGVGGKLLCKISGILFKMNYWE